MSDVSKALRLIKRKTGLVPAGRFCYFQINGVDHRLEVSFDKVEHQYRQDDGEWITSRRMTHSSFPHWLHGFFNMGRVSQRKRRVRQ